jgi:hypothetical protein
MTTTAKTKTIVNNQTTVQEWVKQVVRQVYNEVAGDYNDQDNYREIRKVNQLIDLISYFDSKSRS